MDGRPFALSTLKRIGILLWLAEPTLRSIRDPKSPNFHNVYTWGFEMRRYSRLASEILTTQTQQPPPPPPPAPAPAPASASAFASASERRDYKSPPVVDDDEQVAGILRDHKTSTATQELRAIQEIWQSPSYLDLGRLLSGPTKQYRRLGFNFSAFGKEDERAKRSPRTVEFRIMDGTVRSDLILGWLQICSTVTEAAVQRTDGRFAKAVDRFLRRLGGGGEPQYFQSSSSSRKGGPGMAVMVERDSARQQETLGVRLGREFRELMQDLAVPRGVYFSFEEKVRQEHSELSSLALH
jgi:hypothetical protein